MIAPNLNRSIPKKTINIIFVNKSIDITYTDDSCMMEAEKILEIESPAHSNQCTETNTYLRLDVICKMIDKFLTIKKMSKESLAALLDIDVSELYQLIERKENSLVLIPKINLPLIKFYCMTDFYRQ